MATGNMFENVFEKAAAEAVPDTSPKGGEVVVSEQSVKIEKRQQEEKSDGLFRLKDLAENDRKSTTIIFSKKNYILLKKLPVDEGLNMSEVVNRMLEDWGRKRNSRSVPNAGRELPLWNGVISRFLDPAFIDNPASMIFLGD